MSEKVETPKFETQRFVPIHRWTEEQMEDARAQPNGVTFIESELQRRLALLPPRE